MKFRDRYAGIVENPPWRLVGAVDGTTLTWDPAPPPGASMTLGLGQVALFNSPGPFVVKSQDKDHPFYVSGYMEGCAQYDPDTSIYHTDCRGDPEFVNVIPPDQYLSEYVFFTDPTYPETNLVLVRKKNGSAFEDVSLDCLGNVTTWQPLDAAGNYQYALVDLVTGDYMGVNGCDNGRHKITSKAPFGLTVWGWGSGATCADVNNCQFGTPEYTQFGELRLPGRRERSADQHRRRASKPEVNAPHPVVRLPEEWRAALSARGERAFVAKQVFDWIHRQGVVDAAAMTNLSPRLREALAGEGLAPGIVSPERVHASADGTRKVVVRLADGATVETVLLPAVSGPGQAELDADAAAADDDGEEDEGERAEPEAGPKVRVTQCISTQVGCAMGCVFCASGVAGLKRQLLPEEIVGQVLLGRALLEPNEALRNVVYMGMGEPLHNYDATARSLRLLTHPGGIALSTRRVTVSTSGLVPEIERLGADFQGHIGLAISLHAADDETRSALMPINRRYPLARLMQALRDYPLPKRRRITIEYTLVAGQNDDVDEAKKVARLLRGVPVKINLIPMNPIEHSSLGPPTRSHVEAFQRVLTDAGYSCFVRKRRGDDVSAACGQLVLLGAKPKVRGFRAPDG